MRLIALCLALLLPALPLHAQPVTDFTLPNGLEVVVIEDHRAPVVVQMLWYRTGSADEPAGKSGIAHFLEHLMFKGTEKIGPGAFSAAVEAQGGNDNAFTSTDYTAYFQRVAADRLSLMMEMEADRMVNLRLAESDVLTERNVILEERTQRTDSDPGALFNEQRQAAQYLNHPYGTPIIGWRHEIAALGPEDALTFYRAHYAPNNAVLVVAGDVVPDEVRALAETHYGPIPANPDLPPRIRRAEPPQLAERRVMFADPRVGQPYVMRTYLAPARKTGTQDRAAALVVLAELLGGSPATSVLGRALQFDKQTATHTFAWYDAVAVDDTLFGLGVVPAEGTTLEEAEAAMDAVLAQFLADGVDRAAFERIMAQLEAAEVYARDNTQSVARRYGAALASGLTVADERAWRGVLQSVTPDAVMEAAKDVFDRRRAVTGHLMREVTP
ncbi:M16 family metallopeptidase [Ruixingdingia sedimenti]|uniref:Pitrilysin family protein n=1 Tax=Ruixingdingia sedimenti TaxID=3073604 RepID=A0ABU1F6T9_9RHOB|nr:pitrilysin family protein [Xinfangfangia sp. LG-4]MDR5652590.1 pitrilysin family protein [Xinfangfangia sp. LG-4]